MAGVWVGKRGRACGACVCENILSFILRGDFVFVLKDVITVCFCLFLCGGAWEKGDGCLSVCGTFCFVGEACCWNVSAVFMLVLSVIGILFLVFVEVRGKRAPSLEGNILFFLYIWSVA